MKTVYSPAHKQHAPAQELTEGRFVACFEKPERAEIILKHVTAAGLGAVIAPDKHDDEVLRQVHDADYLRYLEELPGLWAAAEMPDTPVMLPTMFNVYNPALPRPTNLPALMGYYTGDGYAPMTATSWQAIRASADCALTAAALVQGGERAAFALCRPPGHHATRRVAGGYCFINNAAAAAQSFLNAGAGRVAILDIDYHHGNGTQDIFYERDDVLCVSLHADPAVDYPFYMGFADEYGAGRGAGYNVNMPLPHGSGYAAWAAALDEALVHIADCGVDAVVVSLGLDTYKADPISKFTLESDDYLRIGATIAGMSLPTLFVMEGGYAVDALGLNTANVLKGFEEK